ARRGQVTGQAAARTGMAILTGRAPLGELLTFQSRLKSLTAGQGSYTLSLSHYDPVPPNVQRQLVDNYHPGIEE
ncbi:MAG: elongation factor G, partial [Methylococcus sp.]